MFELGGYFYQGVLWEDELLGLVRDLLAGEDGAHP
jgi:hypothetical protein